MKFFTVFGAIVLSAYFFATASLAADKPDIWANAQTIVLHNGENKEVGTAKLVQAPHGVLIHLNLTNVPAGTHAFHIHAVGKCETPDFKSAGGHFNPTEKKHGLLNKEGPHIGDLPNITVPDSGSFAVDAFVSHVTLKEGEHTLADADGSAIVLHAGADDYMTDPAGDAGARIACGVIAPPQAAAK